MNLTRSYSELVQFDSFIDRFNYLKLDGSVGLETFGSNRYTNQAFYASREWKQIRNHVILRDMGCDLGVEGYDILGKILIHHINPLDLKAIKHAEEALYDPENLITVSFATHNAIHYGDISLLITEPVVRRPNDTVPWKEA